jgi:hypothetical protein
MSLSNIMLLPIGGYSFRDALLDLAPYSPRLSFNFIDPANSLFQGNTLTPVTSATNPVGVVIDQTQGGLSNLGADIVTNGNFSNGTTGWSSTSPVSFSVSSGQALVARNSAATSSFPTQDIGMVAGRWYQIKVDIIARSNNVSIYLGSPAVGNEAVFSTTGTDLVRIVQATGSSIFFGPTGSVAATCTIDNLRVCEIPGNHATASSDAKRPLFARYPATGRRNLLIQTEDISTGWTRSGLTASSPTILRETAATGTHYVYQTSTLATGDHTLRAVVKADGRNWIRLHVFRAAAFAAYFNLETGSIGTETNLVSASIVDLGDGWFECQITFNVSASGSADYGIRTASGNDSDSFTGSTSLGIQYRLAQFETGSTATNYQRVVTSADITEAGVRDVYASLYDGGDDALTVSGFDLSDTDKVTVIAGVRKLSDADTGTIIELTSNSASTSGAFALFGPSLGGADNFRFRSRGTTTQDATAAGSFASPVTSFLVGCGDIGGDVSKLSINGTAVATNTGDQGTGNYANSTLNIGGRNNAATVPFNGYLHYMFICGAIVPDAVLTKIFRGLGPRIGLTV